MILFYLTNTLSIKAQEFLKKDYCFLYSFFFGEINKSASVLLTVGEELWDNNFISNEVAE